MVSKCANPSCDNPFRYLREGKLFLVKAYPDGPAGNVRSTRDPPGASTFGCAHDAP